MISKTTKIVNDQDYKLKLKSKEYFNPKHVYLPIVNARCAKGEVYVNEGDYVKVGQVIGERDGGFFKQPICSTVSGKYVGNQKMFHRGGKLVDCIKIENDCKHIIDDTIKSMTIEEVKQLDKEEFIEKVKNSGLVGLGGSGFPTYIKLQTKDKINSVLINGIECEPFLSSDYKILMEAPERVVKALDILVDFFNAKEGIIVFKEKYHDVAEVLTLALREHGNDKLRFETVPDYYPAGWEISMFKDVLGVSVKPGTLPTSYGVIGFNSSTAVGLYRALILGVPVTKRHFTLTGNGIKYPRNFRVVIGTPMNELIDDCGGYTDAEKDVNKVFILGGPMMGTSVVRDNVVVSKTTTSVIILDEVIDKEYECVRCGSCTYSCPVGLIPVQLMNATKAKNTDAINKLNIKSCILCGMCSYTCTSKIHLTEFMRRAKKLVE